MCGEIEEEVEIKKDKIYKAAVYGQTHTQQKDTSGHIHKYMDGHIQQHMGEHMHEKRTQVGTYTSIWVSTYKAEGYGQTHTYKTMVGCTINKSTVGNSIN
jgi:hypothetical protein